MIDLPSQIKQMRTQAGYTQQALAKKLGTSQSTIALWEKPGYTGYILGKLEELAKACGCELEVYFHQTYYREGEST